MPQRPKERAPCSPARRRCGVEARWPPGGSAAAWHVSHLAATICRLKYHRRWREMSRHASWQLAINPSWAAACGGDDPAAGRAKGRAAGAAMAALKPSRGGHGGFIENAAPAHVARRAAIAAARGPVASCVIWRAAPEAMSAANLWPSLPEIGRGARCRAAACQPRAGRGRRKNMRR